MHEGGHTQAMLTRRQVGIDSAPIEGCIAHEGAGGDIPRRVALHTHYRLTACAFTPKERQVAIARKDVVCILSAHSAIQACATTELQKPAIFCRWPGCADSRELSFSFEHGDFKCSRTIDA